jgi:hypothetical protein
MLAFNNDGYGRWVVSGGNCPPYEGLDWAPPRFIPYPNTCLNASRSWRGVGCQALPSSPDLNDTMNKIMNIERISGYIGGAYILTIIIALIDLASVRKSPLYQPIERQKTKRLKFALYMACISLLFGLVYAPIVVATHFKQLHRPMNVQFADSWGPLQYINRTAASAKTATTFDYGNATMWTDCFTVGAPWDARGDALFSEWWKSIDPVPRIIGLI